MNGVTELTSDNWEQEVTNSETPVLVDFWAPWCGPCKAMEATVGQMVAESEGKFKVCKINIDDYSSVAAKFDVKSIPTFLVFKTGVVQDRIVGAMPKASLMAKMNKHVG